MSRHSQPDGDPFGGFMFHLIQLGRFHVDEHPSAPHSRLGCNHFSLLLLTVTGTTWVFPWRW
jgi:hypothetical protein